MTLIIILGILFAVLMILVPLLERSKTRVSEETQSKIARWIWPLLGILLLAQLLRMMFE